MTAVQLVPTDGVVLDPRRVVPCLSSCPWSHHDLLGEILLRSCCPHHGLWSENWNSSMHDPDVLALLCENSSRSIPLDGSLLSPHESNQISLSELLSFSATFPQQCLLNSPLAVFLCPGNPCSLSHHVPPVERGLRILIVYCDCLFVLVCPSSSSWVPASTHWLGENPPMFAWRFLVSRHCIPPVIHESGNCVIIKYSAERCREFLRACRRSLNTLVRAPHGLHVFRRITYNMETGEEIADDTEYDLMQEGRMERSLPDGVTYIRTRFHVLEEFEHECPWIGTTTFRLKPLETELADYVIDPKDTKRTMTKGQRKQLEQEVENLEEKTWCFGLFWPGEKLSCPCTGRLSSSCSADVPCWQGFFKQLAMKHAHR